MQGYIVSWRPTGSYKRLPLERASKALGPGVDKGVSVTAVSHTGTLAVCPVSEAAIKPMEDS